MAKEKNVSGCDAKVTENGCRTVESDGIGGCWLGELGRWVLVSEQI